MHKLLDNTTSTSQGDFFYLPPGDWEIELTTEVADASASIALVSRQPGETRTRAVANSSGDIALTEAYPTTIVESTGKEYAATRSGGTQAVTVRAKPAPKPVR